MNVNRKPFLPWIVWIAVLIPHAIEVSVLLAGGIEGHGRFERVKGQPQLGYVELYESNLFLSPPGGSPIGPSRRLGTTCWSAGVCNTQVITSDGCYCIDNMPAGTYSILLNQPLFFITPKVIPNVVVSAAGNSTVHVELPIDYSCYYKDDWTASSESTWYQTFVATGMAIRGVAFSYAGSNRLAVDVAILEDNGLSDVRQWRLVAQRADYQVTDVADNWVRFRSTDAPTVPDRRYAVRLAVSMGGIQPYKRNKNALSYSEGQAYNSAGIAQNFDLNVTVFSDNDGTMVTMNKRTEGQGDLLEGNFASKWGQTFVAQGTGLAAVDVWAAGANSRWDLNFTWRVYPGSETTGPAGPQIGPTKTTMAAYQAFGVGLHGVSYNPNDVPLVASQTYFIEFEVTNPPPDSNGFNPFLMADDSYNDGIGFQWTGASWWARPSVDVNMTIIEYAPSTPLVLCQPSEFQTTVFYTGTHLPDTLTVRNTGTATLNYHVEEATDWMEVSPLTGTIAAGGSDDVTISYLAAGLVPGSYSGTICVSSDDVYHSSQTVPVTLVVSTVLPDFDHDTDVDMSDYGHLQRCFSGMGIAQTDPDCQDARLDADVDVDAADLGLFMKCFKGSGFIAEPNCMSQ